MKNLTIELKQSSISKWEEIIALIKKKENSKNVTDIYREHLRIGYYDVYWRPCGLCKVVEHIINGCNYCSLFILGEDILICNRSADSFSSHAYLALLKANSGEFEKALHHAEIVLKAIKAVEVEA